MTAVGQPSLFDRPVPFQRGSDTSAAAARSMEPAGRLRRAVVEAYRKAGSNGLTPDECAGLLGETVLAIRPRVTEALQLRCLIETGIRRANASGRKARVLKWFSSTPSRVLSARCAR
jgi:hypothetical protein